MTVLVVIGVSSSGKSTVGILLAKKLGWAFQEGDDLHPKANIDKMTAGIPLTDADRAPWLQSIADHIQAWREQGISGVVTCSALKRAYRDEVVAGREDVRIVYLQGSRELIGERMAARKGHFMPTSLLDSQFQTLEEPTASEHAIVVHIGPPPEIIVEQIIAALK